MSRRMMIVLLVLLALAAGVVLLRPGEDEAAAAGQEQEDDAEVDEAIVAPSRVVQRDGESRVVLDSAETRRIGLTMAALLPASARAGRRLPGQVIPEPERTAAVRAPVTGRLTVSDGDRWPSLGQRIRAGAALGRVSDAQPLTAPMGGDVTAVAARPGEIVEAGQVLLEIADNAHPVVRVSWPLDAGRPRDRVMLLPAAGSAVEAALIGPAPEADPLTRQPAYLYRARARWAGAVPGTPVSALLPDGEQAGGVLVPDAAVVQWDGLAWAYLRRGPGEYARVRVPTEQPVTGGWVAGRPLATGDSVVVTGVQELLSEEFRSRVTVGEESGE